MGSIYPKLAGKPTLTHALDAHYYTDAEIYEREKTAIFARTWNYAGHISQLPDSGSYFTFKIADQSLFCVRGRDDVVRAFYNVCQHRAHELVQGSGKSSVIVCPYHAWTYEHDGRLRAGPNIKNVPGFDKESVCLESVKLEVMAGFIFVNLDPAAKSLAEWYPNVEAELRSFVPQIDRLKPLMWTETTEKCNWKVSVENYSECYHCSLNHPTFSQGVVKPETYDIQPQGYCLRHTTEMQALDSMTYPIDMSVENAGNYSSWFLWPGISFQVYPGNVLNTYIWEPKGVDSVTVWRGWYTVDGEESDVIRALAQQDLDTTVAEDVVLVESVQRGMMSRGYKPGPLVMDPKCGVNSEHSIQNLMHWAKLALD